MSTFVNQIVKQHKVAVFSKITCPYCDKAKNVLKKYQINDIKIVELDDRPDAGEIQDYLAKITGARTVPRVFIGGNCIGGGDDSAKLDRENKLKPMLQNCGAL